MVFTFASGTVTVTPWASPITAEPAVDYIASFFVGREFNTEFTPVPEPTTIVAGAMLLLPFGMSTLRMLRKSRTA